MEKFQVFSLSASHYILVCLHGILFLFNKYLGSAYVGIVTTQMPGNRAKK